MLRILVASQPARAGWLGGMGVSTVAHGALIALAVTASGSTFSSVSEERAASPERISYVETRRIPDAAPSDAAKKSDAPPAKPAETAAPDFAAMNAAIADELELPEELTLGTAPDITSVTDAWLTRGDDLGAPAKTIAELLLERSGFTPPANGVYTTEMVERSVAPKQGNPTPKYPRLLADLSIEGDFMVKFVVDSTGVVRKEQIEFPESMHRLFADAVRSALLKSRYMPAVFGGRFVPQLVVQEFRFSMKNRR